jgi:hypothetical protein
MSSKAPFWGSKKFKKVKKGLATPWRLPLNGDLTRQIAL